MLLSRSLKEHPDKARPMKPAPPVTKIFMLFPAYLLLLVLAVIVLPVDRVWLSAIAGPWNDPKGDVLVVLGADSIPDMIGLSSYWRAVYAVRVWREGGFRRIVLSGMRVGWQMQQFLVCQGVPAAAIVVEDRSRDTHGNAIEAARFWPACRAERCC